MAALITDLYQGQLGTISPEQQDGAFQEQHRVAMTIRQGSALDESFELARLGQLRRRKGLSSKDRVYAEYSMRRGLPEYSDSWPSNKSD